MVLTLPLLRQAGIRSREFRPREEAFDGVRFAAAALLRSPRSSD
jgi:hypothetical protein